MKFKGLFRSQIFPKYKLVFNKTMFIRSTDKPNAKSLTSLNKSQPYTKYFVLDFEATCDNGAHLLKPQVDFLFKLKCLSDNGLIFNSSKEKNRNNHF